MAEVVAPCVLIGCEDAVAAVAEDEAQRPMPMTVPGWWHFETVPVVVPEVPIAATVKAKPKSDGQLLALMGMVAPAPAEVAVAAGGGKGAVLAGSAVWKALGLEKTKAAGVLRAVEVLMARHGVMTDEAFAAEVGVMGFRVGGFVARLGEVLNQDGFEVIRFDPVGRQVVLNGELLGQLFEVSL